MLLEREGELATLIGLVDDLGTDGGKVVLIRGEAGIGKSALVEAFVGSLDRRTQVISGACDDLFIPQALGPFWDMARAEPLLREPLYAGDRPRLVEALISLISRPDRPSVVVIEDTHWADEGTFDAIRYIGRRIARTNGILLLTYRDGEVDYDHPLRGVVGDLPPGDVVRLQLGGLSLAAVTQLVGEAGIDAGDTYRATRGNPLLVAEMGVAAQGGIPGSLQDSLLGRLRRLTTGSQEMLKLLSVIPEPIPSVDAQRLPGVDSDRLDECITRGFIEVEAGRVSFRHDLIRRAVEASLAEHERRAKFAAVLAGLPEETHPCLLIHCAREVEDVDRLIDLAPRSARYAATTGSHQQAAEDFREVGPHLALIDPHERAPLLDEWAREEFLVDDIEEALRLNELAGDLYHELDDRGAVSRALAWRAHYLENSGRREAAMDAARAAVAALGEAATGADLANALEVNAYLQMMAGNVTAVRDLVARALEAGGPDIDETVRIRSLNHRGIVDNIANYPKGRRSLDEARKRAETAGQWFEECRALLNHAWAAAEARDVTVALDYARRGIASAERHELPILEAYVSALYARALEMAGRWHEAADIARGLLDAASITRMVALPVIGTIDLRRGRPETETLLAEAWEIASATGEVQRTSPAAMAIGEQAWLTGTPLVGSEDLVRAMHDALELGFSWSPGAIAVWLWRCDLLDEAPHRIAAPYRASIEGRARDAAATWERLGIPYERALALSDGDVPDQLEALELLETLGATAVAAKLRKTLRDRGVTVTRGKGKATRGNEAGLTARQAEVLRLLGRGMSNTQIADELFVSPRTVENHVAAVLDKLDVSSRSEAVERARSSALL